jgi:integrase
MNNNYPTPYTVGKIFHFRFTDKNGKRVRMSTGFSRKSDAQKFIKDFIDKQRSGIDTTTTVREALKLYQDPETNPKRRQATVTTSFYSDRYALHTARHAKDLETVLNKSMKKFLDKPLSLVLRYEIKQAAVAIVEEHGACNKSLKLYKLLNGQAADDGLIQMNTAQGLPDIRFNTTSRKSLPASDIQLVLSSPQIFPNQKARQLFTILATTGLRRSELLALHPDQLKDDILTIDRAYKDDSLKVIGLPKWGKVRVIPLCDIALKALKEAFEENPNSNEPLRVSSRMLSIWFKTIRTHALQLKLERPEAWKELTPHVLRHSLNTNLRLSGVFDILVAEYLSWEHQGGNAVQEGYTHVYANNLRPVADCIETIYGQSLNVLKFCKKA